MWVLSKMRINDDRFFKLEFYGIFHLTAPVLMRLKKLVHKPDFWNPYKEKRQKHHLVGKEMLMG